MRRKNRNYPTSSPTTQIKIVWAGQENTVTPIAFFYLHGFSDSNRAQGESIDRMDAEFGAYIYCTRNAGHSFDDEAGIEALGNATLH